MHQAEQQQRYQVQVDPIGLKICLRCYRQMNSHEMHWCGENHVKDVMVVAENMEVLNNNAKNTYIRRDYQFLKPNNLTYRNSTHIPAYNNYVTIPKSTQPKVRLSCFASFLFLLVSKFHSLRNKVKRLFVIKLEFPAKLVKFITLISKM